MTSLIILLLGFVLTLAPNLAAIPDEPIWSSWLCAATMLAVFLATLTVWRGSRPGWLRVSRSEKTFLLLLGLAFLSIPARMLVQHGTGYFGPMLRGWALLATNFALFALARRLAADRMALYALIFAAIVGSVIAADIGVQEYAAHLRAGQSSWRIFGTSTPDYLAGYFVLLLPVTLALFLQTPSLRRLTPLLRAATGLVFGVVVLFQLVALLATSSRFALLSLVVGLLTFGAALTWTIRRGYRLERWLRYAACGMALLVGMAGVRFAGPVMARLHNLNDNSVAFRVWTWKGAVKMAEANPLFGTGIGTWPDLYPRYAYTGFTRVAHNSYLQMADECGLPALLALLATLALLGVSVVRGLAITPPDVLPIPRQPSLPQGRRPKRSTAATRATVPKLDFLPTDHRLLLCGLLAALAGGAVQNLSDSDWYVFFLGTTFWTLAGLAAGIAAPITAAEEAPALKPLLIAIGSVAAALGTLTAGQGIAASRAAEAQAMAPIDPAGAAQTYGAARAWDPLNGRYPSDQGYKVYYLRGGDLNEAEKAVRTAVALEPTSVNYRRLGTILQAGGSQAEALQAYQNGLRAEPNSLDILQDLARLTPLPHSLDYYRRISDLELTPVGTVRALGETTETKFARADIVMADEAAKTNPRLAASYDARAAKVLEHYADEGGSMNPQQQALLGGHSNPAMDADMRGLYQHVMTAWIALAPPAEQPGLRQRQQEYLRKFEEVYSRSSKPGIM